MWVLPETAGSNSAYKIYDTGDGQLHRIYGGNPEQTKSFDSHTVIDTGLVYKNFEVNRSGETLLYVVNGETMVNGKLLKDGDLMRADVIDLKVISDDAHLTIISVDNS